MQLGQTLDPKDTKRPKNPASTFEEPGAKTEGQERKQGVRSKGRALRMCPAHHNTRGVGRPPKPRPWPDPWTHPYPHPI